MSSKYTEAFDSLHSDDNTKHERAERILSSLNASAKQKTQTTGAKNAFKERRRIFSGRRGVALLTATAVSAAALTIFLPVGMSLYNSGNLLNAMSKLKGTFVDMDGVAAFGVWNAPESDSEPARISDVAFVRTTSQSTRESEIMLTAGNDGVLPNGWENEDWSDEERYDWESDYDWDPTKANVLIAIGEDGKINEVVYERTNGRGQVRQDALGNAAAVYVSNGFTYVMYVNDSEWKFWADINFAQEMRSPSGFACHHESEQTIVIHNATGKVFALKDLIPQVSELSGATNYTMQVDPFKDDYLCVRPMYGNLIPQWYNVIYDEQLQKIRYEPILPADSGAENPYTRGYHIRAVRRDKYGQQYLLEGFDDSLNPRVSAGIVQLPAYTRYDNKLVFSTPNGMMLGTDGRMYAFDDGKLKVFGKNFELSPVEAGTKVAFEGVADDYEGRASRVNDGIAYKLENGYLYSMFGEVWKVDGDGTMRADEPLEGSFPRYADDGYLLGGEIIAFVDADPNEYYGSSINGRMVQIRFDATEGEPRAVITHIIDASEFSVRNHRMVLAQNERPYTSERGETKYFLLTVQDGVPTAEYFAYGFDGSVYGLTKPITEPLVLS